jgi:hypothetical protein
MLESSEGDGRGSGVIVFTSRTATFSFESRDADADAGADLVSSYGVEGKGKKRKEKSRVKAMQAAPHAEEQSKTVTGLAERESTIRNDTFGTGAHRPPFLEVPHDMYRSPS